MDHSLDFTTLDYVITETALPSRALCCFKHKSPTGECIIFMKSTILLCAIKYFYLVSRDSHKMTQPQSRAEKTFFGRGRGR